MIKKVTNRINWWRYKRQIRQHWRLWDKQGGGQYAVQQIAPFKLLSRPSYNPAPPDDPIFQTSHYKHAAKKNIADDFVEYVYHLCKPCYIEPEYGYTIMEPSVLIPESLAWSSNFALSRNHLQYFSGVPSLTSYAQARQGNKEVREEDIIVSLRHIFDLNYGHCLIQLLPTLQLLDECGVSPKIPLLISSRLAKAPFFQEIIKRGDLQERQWITEEDAYIHAKEVIFARTDWPNPEMLNACLDKIGAPYGAPDANKRLFILRNNRNITNMEEITAILKKFNFAMVRPETLTVAEQMALFAQASIVCGVGGAALTNAVFGRGNPVQMLEVCPLNWDDLFFYRLAKTCSFSHSFLVGGPLSADRFSSFVVNPDAFNAFLSEAVRAEK